MLLPAFALLFDLLLLLQFFCDAGLSQGLPLAALIGLGIQGGLQSRVTPHAHHHLLAQLWTRRRNDRVTDEGSMKRHVRCNDCTPVFGSLGVEGL